MCALRHLSVPITLMLILKPLQADNKISDYIVLEIHKTWIKSWSTLRAQFSGKALILEQIDIVLRRVWNRLAKLL